MLKLGWRPSLVGGRPSLLGGRPSLIGYFSCPFFSSLGPNSARDYRLQPKVTKALILILKPHAGTAPQNKRLSWGLQHFSNQGRSTSHNQYLLQPKSNGLQPSSDGLHPSSDKVNRQTKKCIIATRKTALSSTELLHWGKHSREKQRLNQLWLLCQDAHLACYAGHSCQIKRTNCRKNYERHTKTNPQANNNWNTFFLSPIHGSHKSNCNSTTLVQLVLPVSLV